MLDPQGSAISAPGHHSTKFPNEINRWDTRRLKQWDTYVPFSLRSSIIMARAAIFFCSAARVYLSASLSVIHPKIDISSCDVALFSAAITAPVLRRPCAVH